MKRTNKYLSLALAIIMALSLCVTSFAAEIAMQNVVVGESYSAYKLFNVTKSGDNNYAYTIEAGDPWYADVKAYADVPANGLTLQATQTEGHFNVFETSKGSLDAAAFAAYLADKVEGKTAAQTVKATSTEVTFTGLAAGYYFVDSTLGSLCGLLTGETTMQLVEKNTVPSVDKLVNGEKTISANIDEEFTYTITVTDGKATDGEITLNDVMENGITIVGDVTVSGVEGATVNVNGNQFTVKFDAAKVADGAAVVVTYKAKLNENAEIDAANNNKVTMEYSAQKSTSEADVYTYDFKLTKTDGTNQIDGAEFKLYDAETAGKEIKVVPVMKTVGEGDEAKQVVDYYRVAKAGEEGVAIKVGQATIKGLKEGTYYLEETKAPDGYNMLTERKAISVGVENEAIKVSEITVVNQAGGILPGTGGVGTTMFYVLGSVMMIGAAVLLITKKKMANEQ